MRTLPTLALSVLAVATLTGLTGCLDTTPHPPATPTPTPLFATEDEALEAATAAYAEYLRVSNSISSEGGVRAERLAQYTTPDRLEVELTSYAAFAQTGHRQVGSALLASVVLAHFSQDAGGAEVVLYTCIDSSHTSFVDLNSVDVTPRNRETRQTLEVIYEFMPSPRLADVSLWTGSSVC